MQPPLSLPLAVSLVALTGVPAGRAAEAPPPNPPVLERSLPPSAGFRPLAETPYSIGDPTDEEQLYVEYINRARSDPPAEGRRLVATTDAGVQSALEFFNVDLAMVVAQFDAIAPAPPVSIHPRLTAAARTHSEDMFQNTFQGHVGSDGSSAGQRVTRAGYVWSRLGENVYSKSESVWYGHAGFNVDWGFGPGGIQSPPGHRNTIHDAGFREVGVGIRLGTKGDVGPQLVTQEFATAQGATPFITGVVHYDLDGDAFYSPGEGLGGVTVQASGVATPGISAGSGGYSVPVPNNGNYTVTFKVPGSSDVTTNITIAGLANRKVDLRLPYQGPALGGSSVAYLNQDQRYLVSPVGGASAYQFRQFTIGSGELSEGFESGLGNWTAVTAGGYDLLQTTHRRGGASALRLAHPAFSTESITLTQPILPAAGSTLTFWSRLGIATQNEVARVLVSTTDAPNGWVEIWSQAGADQPGESSFQQRTVSLAAYAGRPIRLQFAFEARGGKYAPTHPNVGWFIDDIAVSQAQRLSNETVGDAGTAAGTPGFTFRPTQLGDHFLQARPLNGTRAFPWGTGIRVTVQEGGPTPLAVRLAGLEREAGGWSLRARVEAGTPSQLRVQAATSPTGPWSTLPNVFFEPVAADEFITQVPAGQAPDTARFFRLLID